MKKVLVMLAALLMVAGSAMAMKAISESQMDSITGQAGVSIAVDDVKLYQHLEGLWYADTDGLNGTNPAANGLHTDQVADGASVGISDLEVMVNVNSITSYNATGLHSIGRELQGTYGSRLDVKNDDGNNLFVAKPITIDVTQALPALSAGARYNTSDDSASLAGVMIGLGTVEVVQSNMELSIGINDLTPLNSSDDLTSLNHHNYGTVYLGKTTLAVLDGNIEIAPH